VEDGWQWLRLHDAGLRADLRVVLADDLRSSARPSRAGAVGSFGAVTDESWPVRQSAAEHLSAFPADVLLPALRMPVCDGVEAARRVRAEHPGTAVVVLTTYADDASVVEALRAGAAGWLSKDADAEAIGRALRSAADGHTTVDSAALARPWPPSPRHSGPRRAARRAHRPRAEVLGLIASGLSNTEIARRLVVSEATVKTHVNHLFAKAGLRDRAQAVGYAYRHGLVE
jgi:DNA-binding NarL/FixJ family response regulator